MEDLDHSGPQRPKESLRKGHCPAGGGTSEAWEKALMEGQPLSLRSREALLGLALGGPNSSERRIECSGAVGRRGLANGKRNVSLSWYPRHQQDNMREVTQSYE